jgi:hypothetical protein
MKTWKKSSRLRAGVASTTLTLPLAIALSACRSAQSGSGSSDPAMRPAASASIAKRRVISPKARVCWPCRQRCPKMIVDADDPQTLFDF